MLPTQNRPAGSQTPSFRRSPSPCGISTRVRTDSSSRSTIARRSASATRTPPSVVGAAAPTRLSSRIERSSPVAGSKTCSAWASMSTQSSLPVAASQRGHSPSSAPARIATSIGGRLHECGRADARARRGRRRTGTRRRCGRAVPARRDRGARPPRPCRCSGPREDGGRRRPCARLVLRARRPADGARRRQRLRGRRGSRRRRRRRAGGTAVGAVDRAAAVARRDRERRDDA